MHSNVIFQLDYYDLISYLLILKRCVDTWGCSSHVPYNLSFFCIVDTFWVTPTLWKISMLVVSSTSQALKRFTWLSIYCHYKFVWTTFLLMLLSLIWVVLGILLLEISFSWLEYSLGFFLPICPHFSFPFAFLISMDSRE